MMRTAGSCFLAASLLIGASLVVFRQLAVHPTDLLVGPQRGGLNDMTDSILPARHYPARSLTEAGTTPFWNPYALSGMPWLANPQSALFYPPNWVYALCREPALVGWMMVFHHWLAGLGTFFLCRRYGFGWSSALLGGCVFLGAPYLIANTGEGHYNPICVMGWVPWAFLAYERVRAQRTGGVALQALTLALCFFCGHVQEVLYLVLILTVFLIRDAFSTSLPLRKGRSRGDVNSLSISSEAMRKSIIDGESNVWSAPPPTPPFRRGGEARGLLLRWVAVGLATAGLVAVDLLPIRSYTKHAARVGGLSLAESGAGGLSVNNLRQLFDPFVLGGPAESSTNPADGLFWETVTHFGIAPLCLAIIGVLFAARRYPVGRMTTLWLFGMLFALGTNGPIFAWLHAWVPGISLFRIPSRALFFCSLATAVLAAAGTDAIVAGVVAIMRKYGARSVAAMRVLGSVVAITLAVSCVVELSQFSNRVLRTIPRESIRTNSPVVEFLKERAGQSRVMAGQDLLSDREAWSSDLYKVHGYDPVPLLNYVRLIDALTRHRDPTQEIGGFQPIDLHEYHQNIANLLGVRYAVLQAQDAPEEWRGWRRVATGETMREVTLRDATSERLPFAIYENPDNMPRAFVIGTARELGRQEDGVEVMSALDPRRELLMTKDVLPAGPRQEYRPVEIVEYGANRIVIDAQLDAPGYLVLSDVWFPGWSAESNGKPVPVLEANLALRAMPLAAGSQRVVLSYVPPGLRLGALLSVLTLVTFAGVTGLRLFQSRDTRANDAAQM